MYIFYSEGISTMKVIAYIINIIFILTQLLVLLLKIIDYGSPSLLETVNPIRTVIYLIISIKIHIILTHKLKIK